MFHFGKICKGVETMIPKVIHYCWFGGNPLPDSVRKCIHSWKKFCPDYDIKQWDETNINLHENAYVLEAYQAKKWAFITDYVRLKVLVEYGGIYMDTDVEVLKPIDVFLSNHAFSGFEDVDCVPTGIMACEKGYTLFKELLDDYKNRHFILPDKSYDMTTNVVTITKQCVKHGLVLNNTLQNIEGFCLYPKDFFCPKSHVTGEIKCTSNTYTIHHFAGSWHTPYQRFKAKIKKILGCRLTKKIIEIKNKLYGR